jgi:hypothetical protein
MYRIKSTGEIKSQGEIRAMYPNTSFPSQWSAELVANLGLDPVFETPAPTTTRYQTASKDGVEQVEGKWQWKWVVTEMSDEAKAAIDAQQAAAVRSTRNARIAECDWTQLDDTPITNSKKLEWAAYRQALRDIPDQPGFPWDINWPEKP